jgi:TPR repeat protein
MNVAVAFVGAAIASSLAFSTGFGQSVLNFTRQIAAGPADAPATDCDFYAASDLDRERKANGVPFDKINSAVAVPACESAVRKYPNSVRLVYQLGRAYSKKSDFKSAFAQYQKAADQGSMLAEYDLGVAYQRGSGVAKDEAQAVAWYRRAAEQGFALAQSNLGNMYRAGQGVPQDFAEGLKWLRKAAEQGNIRASLIVGLMYGDGQGATKNYAESVKWLRVAADQGEAEAQRLLGVMYEFGGGVPKNLTDAKDWYRKAASQGNEEAQRKLADLEADAAVNRSALEAGDAALHKALAEKKTTDQAWEEGAKAASLAAMGAELAAGRSQELASNAARQAGEQVRAQAPKTREAETNVIDSEVSVATRGNNLPNISTGRYCEAVKQNIDRINQTARNQELTLPPENRNSPKNPSYKPSRWQVLSCDESTDPNRVGGMVDTGGGTPWYFEALKSAYPFSGGEDIRVDVCSGAAFRDDDILATPACRASGELRKMCERSPGPFNCNNTSNSKACSRRNAICAQELGLSPVAQPSAPRVTVDGNHPPDEVWHRRPGEDYNPSTYCQWGRQQLPTTLQKVCSDLDRKYPQKKQDWRRFEADNGAAFALDMNSVAHLYYCHGCTDAVVCILDNDACPPQNMRYFRFDCHGHYRDTIDRSEMLIAPSRSVVGQMAALACVDAKVD